MTKKTECVHKPIRNQSFNTFQIYVKICYYQSFTHVKFLYHLSIHTFLYSGQPFEPGNNYNVWIGSFFSWRKIYSDFVSILSKQLKTLSKLSTFQGKAFVIMHLCIKILAQHSNPLKQYWIVSFICHFSLPHIFYTWLFKLLETKQKWLARFPNLTIELKPITKWIHWKLS